MESTSSLSASSGNSLRGCNGLGTIGVNATSGIRSPESTAVGATGGRPLMSAPRPLPRPDFAMRLRLPEQHYQSKRQQCAEDNSAATLRLAANQIACAHVERPRRFHAWALTRSG